MHKCSYAHINVGICNLVAFFALTAISACNDGGGSPIALGNIAPVANAGTDQTAGEEVVVRLDGSASSDSDGAIASRTWNQVGGGPITLSGTAVESPTFNTPNNSAGESLAFELTVIDDRGASDTDTVMILITDHLGNHDHNGQFVDAVLVSRNPDCRAFATDANRGNYSSSQVVDVSNGTDDGISRVQIDMVVASSWNAGDFDYANVSVTPDTRLATHCRMISNMIPNHQFGVTVTGPGSEGWINPIDHTDTEITFIPVDPVKSDTPTDTPRNPPVFDFDGILLNGVGVSMDSGFCYNPGVTSGPLALRSNDAGNTSGCGPQNSWFELPAYTIWHHGEENMAAVFDSYFAHGFVGTYHYHAMTHPLQEDDDQTQPPSNGMGSPVIGFAPDGFPIYGHWFANENGVMVRAESGYETFLQNSRTPISSALNGTPPTPWDIANNPGAFASDFGLEMGRYEDDWFYAGTGNLDECNGAFDGNGDYGYYITDKYPFTPPCTFGPRDPSFGKRSPTLPS